MSGSSILLESFYEAPAIEHAYLEVEGGVAVYNEQNGELTVRCSNQYSFRDQAAIAAVLNIPEENIRVIGSPAGGSFGSKDEITAQIHLALVAYLTKKPVYLQWDRTESIVTSIKRHPMTTRFKIGADSNGILKAISVDVKADAGPYDSLSAAVLGLAVESSPGPYRYEHSMLKGVAAYTNNPVGGAFRGFGAPQVLFGLEQEIDKIAEKAGIDPLEMRLQNAVRQGDSTALGNILRTTTGLADTLEKARELDIWKNRTAVKNKLDAESRYLKHGIGIAALWQSVGMGKGIQDDGRVRIDINPDGTLTLRSGSIEMGQGNITVFAQILAEAFEWDIDRIDVVHGDTFKSPDTGSVAASRSVMINGNAIIDAVSQLKERLINAASESMSVPAKELEYRKGTVVKKDNPAESVSAVELIRKETGSERFSATGYYKMIETTETYGAGIPHNYGVYATQIALVGVDTGTGEVEVKKLVFVAEAGKVLNLTGAEGQCEGGSIMGTGYALYEQIVTEKAEILNKGFSTYIIPTVLDVPDQEIQFIEKYEPDGPYGGKGIGELGMNGAAPAIANAIYDAVGVRVTDLPVTPEKIVRALREKDGSNVYEQC